MFVRLPLFASFSDLGTFKIIIPPAIKLQTGAYLLTADHPLNSLGVLHTSVKNKTVASNAIQCRKIMALKIVRYVSLTLLLSNH